MHHADYDHKKLISFKGLGMHKAESVYSGSKEIMTFFERPARHLFPCPELLVTEAADQVIVYHADGLHECVTDCGPHKSETPSFQVLTHRFRFGAPARDLLRMSPLVLYRFSAHKLPNVRVITSKLILHIQKRPCITYSGPYLQAVAHNSRVLHELLYFLPVVVRNHGWVESVKCLAVILALFENRKPAQAGLKTFENKKLE